jgi:ATP-dependent RNA circularization protein (DNA/RNA ligase family)
MERPLNKKSYGSIAHLPESKLGENDKVCPEGQILIATKRPRDWKDLIIVQEKLDGSNMSVAKINGIITPLTRTGYRAIESVFKHHKLFHNWVFKNQSRFDSLLKEGERICGEWILQVHGTHYKLEHEPFVAFDLMVGTDRLIYHEFLLRVLRYDFVIPKLVHMGQPIDVKNVMKILNKSGHGAIEGPEGAVWRIEREGQVDFLVKYVRSDKVDGKYLNQDLFNEGWERYLNDEQERES